MAHGKDERMQLKWIGIVLIISGCGSVGFLMAYHAKREIRYLRQLVSVVDYMSCELSYRLPPLSELVRNASKTQDGCIRRVFLDFADELDSQISPDTTSCMECTVSRFPELPNSVGYILLQLSKYLGLFDLEGQLKSLDGLKSECFMAISQLDDNKQMRTRGYQTLGLCAGAALAVLLI